MKIQRIIGMGVAAICLLTSTACSTHSPPLETLGAAEMAIDEAERLDAGTAAPAELNTAQGKLKMARTAMAEEEFVEARRFSEQAIVDANLARAKAELSRSAEQLEDATEALQEIERETEK